VPQVLCALLLALVGSTWLSASAQATHVYQLPDCAYPTPLDPGAYLYAPCPPAPPSVPSTPTIPTLPPSCEPFMSFDVKQCIVDLKARVPNPPTVPLPASCLPNGGAFDPIACLDGLTPPLPVPPPPPAPPSLPPTPLAPRPPVAFPAECDAGTLYACARALVLQVTGSDCLLRDPIGACLEPTDDPAGPVPIVPPLSDPLSVVVPNICPAAN